jgi:hypothetical protein
MKVSGLEKGEFAHGSSYVGANPGNGDPANAGELFLDELEHGNRKKPSWSFTSLAARMESMAISLWSWLVVGVLSAWFAIWLVQALGRLGTRIP